MDSAVTHVEFCRTTLFHRRPPTKMTITSFPSPVVNAAVVLLLLTTSLAEVRVIDLPATAADGTPLVVIVRTLAAIPAVIAYNKFNSDSKKYSARIENFSKRFLSII